MTRWKVHGTRPAYQSPWVEVWRDDVELPDGDRIDHHVIKFPRASVGAVAVDGDRTLLIWRHRYITDTWGWEIPAGWVDPGEDPAVAAGREIEEETGYRAGSVEHMFTYHPLAGISTMRYTVFLATGLIHIGEPTDRAETVEVAWLPLAELPRLAADRQITDGPSLSALSYYRGMHLA
ncbi:NUDIX hydrolase [Virgisporangium aliadipatigenens]|nr:NUDIX hydrolase [Virgisporangium aliadipatigenens]